MGDGNGFRGGMNGCVGDGVFDGEMIDFNLFGGFGDKWTEWHLYF